MPWDTERIRRFLLEHVDSFEALELLLALAHDAGSEWTMQRAADVVPGTSTQDVRDALEHLMAHGLCAVDTNSSSPRYRYAPASEELREGVQATVTLRAVSPTTVATLMSRNAVERMRAWTAQSFADAFLIGHKAKKDG